MIELRNFFCTIISKPNFRERDLFTKDDTKVIKGVAIILMMYHHLFAFPERIPAGVNYINLLSIAGEPLVFWIGQFGKLCVALFLFLGGVWDVHFIFEKKYTFSYYCKQNI